MSQIIITSAALFYSERREHVPLEWCERALCLFAEFCLEPIMFSAEGGSFSLDDCYFLDEPIYFSRWTSTLAGSARPQLIQALKGNQISTLSLDVPRADASSRADWLVTASSSSVDNEVYVGIDERFIQSPSAILRRGYEMTKDFHACRYGFAYKMALNDLPDCYATGITQKDDIDAWLNKAHDPLRPRTPDERWARELGSQNRHLQGYFRDAYPANLLSGEHVHNARLLTEPLGILEPLDSDTWLWELSDEQIPIARARLCEQQLLIAKLEP